jgi:RNA polymerase sigma-70 factor (ECF subfamily)
VPSADFFREPENAMDDARIRTLREREDEWLAVRCQLGEPEAFDEMIARWHAPIRDYVARLAGGDDAAHDIAQDVWLRVFRGIAHLRDGARLRAWLFGIARRTWIDHLRSRYAQPIADDAAALDDLPDDAQPADDDAAALREHVAALPPLEREAITLFYLDELALGDIADVLGVPVGTVKSRLFRARRLLRQKIDSTGDRT